MQLDVVSDFVCPWCFIGLRRLQAACEMAGEGGVAVGVNWHPFLLNPDTPPEGEPYRAFMVRKFGTEAAVEALHQRVSAAAAGDGIDFRFDQMPVRPSTRLAHGVVSALQAAGHDVGALVTALFEAHFLELRNIGDPSTVADLVGRAGLPADGVDEIFAALPSAESLAELAGALRLDGVPAFVLERRQLLLGAQPAKVLHDAMRSAAG